MKLKSTIRIVERRGKAICTEPGLNPHPWEILRAPEPILETFDDMWGGHFGDTNITLHHISLEPCTHPVLQSPYRIGRKTRKFVAKEVECMNSASIIKPATLECSSSVPNVSKLHGSYGTCIDYKKLYVDTIGNIHLHHITVCRLPRGHHSFFNAGSPLKIPADTGRKRKQRHDHIFKLYWIVSVQTNILRA